MLDYLTDEQKEVIILKFIEGNTNEEAALVTENISRLPKDKATICCMKLEHLCAYHKDLLAGLKSRVPSFQRQELDNAIQMCHHRTEWMGKVIRNEVPMGEWGPFVVNET